MFRLYTWRRNLEDKEEGKDEHVRIVTTDLIKRILTTAVYFIISIPVVTFGFYHMRQRARTV